MTAGGGGKRQAMRWMDEAEIEKLGLCRPNNVSLSPTQPNTVLRLGPFSLIPPPLRMPCQRALAQHPLLASTLNGRPRVSVLWQDRQESAWPIVSYCALVQEQRI